MFDKVFDDQLHRHAHLERSDAESQKQAPPGGAADVKLDDEPAKDLKDYEFDVYEEARWNARREEYLRSEKARAEALSEAADRDQSDAAVEMAAIALAKQEEADHQAQILVHKQYLQAVKAQDESDRLAAKHAEEEAAKPSNVELVDHWKGAERSHPQTAEERELVTNGNVIEFPVQIDAPSTGGTTANDELDQLAAEHTGDAQNDPQPVEVEVMEAPPAKEATEAQVQEEEIHDGIPAQGSNEVRPDDIGEAAAEEGATDRES